ncbi:hypothetical protein [Phyllobacterium sp. SB3]|uniref:hypothetical protein n=1 Tax=Phyllobacterium sp. SB3 TaxID=3156073 RepID=UPI0032AFE5CA
MNNYWFNMWLLGAESQRVVWLRMWKMSVGGPAALAEANLMLQEKIDTAGQSAFRLAMGSSPASIVSNYRRKVKANERRLSR